MSQTDLISDDPVKSYGWDVFMYNLILWDMSFQQQALSKSFTYIE